MNNKLNLALVYPWLGDAQIDVMSSPAVTSVSDVDFAESPTRECDVTCPVDEVTGFRTSPIARIFDPRISPLERERLMASLQKMPASKRNNLSDEELIALTESRYNMTSTDVDKWLQHVRSVVEQFNAEDSSETSSEDDGSDVSDGTDGAE